MRIAQVAPLDEAVSPFSRGDVARSVAALTDALVGLGHEVTLFAPAGSRTRAPLVTPPVESEYSAEMTQVRMLAEVHRRAEAFDLLHFHTPFLQFPLFDAQPDRTVTTCHHGQDSAAACELLGRWNRFALVALSPAQQAACPGAGWVATVPPGLPLDPGGPPANAAGDARGSHLVCFGPIGPGQGIEAAIEIARRSRRRLKLVGPWRGEFRDPGVAALIDGGLVADAGDLRGADRAEVLRRADAALFPAAPSEPFPLAPIEAMAAGCPILAFDGSAAAGVVEPGRTGFRVGSVAAAVDRLDDLGRLDRGALIEAFAAGSTAERMSRDYLSVYDTVLRRAAEPAPPPPDRFGIAPPGAPAEGSAAIVAPTRAGRGRRT